MECRPIGDLGLINGGIPDESITVSSSEKGYTKTVSYISRLIAVNSLLSRLLYIRYIRFLSPYRRASV